MVWVQQEFIRQTEAYGPWESDAVKVVQQRIKEQHNVFGKRLKDQLGMKPNLFIGQIKMRVNGQKNIFDGTLDPSQVYPVGKKNKQFNLTGNMTLNNNAINMSFDMDPHETKRAVI